MQIEDMASLGGRRNAAPNDLGGDPAMHLDARRAGVGLVDDVLQRVEAGGNGGGLGVVAGNAGSVEGVAPAPHLHHDGIEVVGAAIGNELGDLAGVQEAGTPGVHPDAAELAALPARRKRGKQNQRQTSRGRTTGLHRLKPILD